jgi:hypothetical protein
MVDGTSTMWLIVDLRETKTSTPIFLEWCFAQRVKKGVFLPAEFTAGKKRLFFTRKS